MEKISSYQLFATLVLFQIGSTVVFGFANEAGRDVWIAVLVSVCFGAALLSVYTSLTNMQPGLTLVQWFPKQFGRFLGTPVAWLYPLAFLYVAGRVLRDFSELLNGTILPTTPIWAILMPLMVVVIYAICQGFETVVRMAEFLFPFALLLFLLEIALLVSSGILHPHLLLPVLEEGWPHIWQTVWPTNVTVPYGESIVFAMFWTKLNRPKNIRPLAIGATFCYALLMLTADTLTVMTLGERMFQRSLYPLYTLVKQIEAGEFLENLDTILILQICIMVFFKVTLFMLGAIDGIVQLADLPDKRRMLVFPAALLVMFCAYTMATNVNEHMQAGLEVVPRVLWIPLFLVLPFLLLLVTWTRGRLTALREKKSSGS